MLEADVLSEQYRGRYNEYRPHSALGYLTPAAFAASHTPSINLEKDIPQPALALT